MENKTFKTGTIQMTMEKNGFPKGLILNRNLDFDECKYVMKCMFGVEISNSTDILFDLIPYSEYCDAFIKKVNKWLKGEIDDFEVESQYAFGYSISVMHIIPVIEFLRERNILKTE